MRRYIILVIIFLAIIIYFGVSAHPSSYEVTITRKANNIYKVENTNLYLKTRYCYEYCSFQKAILEYSGYGYSKGSIIINNQKYDVEEVLETVDIKLGTMGISRNGEIVELETVLVPTILQ